MTQKFEKQPKHLGKGLGTWDTALMFETRPDCVGKGLRI